MINYFSSLFSTKRFDQLNYDSWGKTIVKSLFKYYWNFEYFWGGFNESYRVDLVFFLKEHLQTKGCD